MKSWRSLRSRGCSGTRKSAPSPTHSSEGPARRQKRSALKRRFPTKQVRVGAEITQRKNKRGRFVPLSDDENRQAASRETSHRFSLSLISHHRALCGQFGRLKAMYSPE